MLGALHRSCYLCRAMLTRRHILLCCAFALTLTASAQIPTDIDELPEAHDGEITPAVAMEVQVRKQRIAYKGDSIPAVIMPTLYKYPAMDFKSKKARERYNRLVANVKRLLPIAKSAKYYIIETYDYMETLPKQERAAHIKVVEADLKKRYTPLLKKLTRSQGTLLVKLIDRECGQTGYNIAKAFVGAFRANMYQALAFCFGQSLTKHYNPEGDDRYTERVVRMVESGQI